MSADIDRNDVLTAMRGIDLFKDVPDERDQAGAAGRPHQPQLPHRLRRSAATCCAFPAPAPANTSAARTRPTPRAPPPRSASMPTWCISMRRRGVMLCRFVDGGVTLNAERFKDLGSVRRSAVALKRVHDNAAPFLNRFELFQMIDEYLDILAKKNAPLPDGYHDVKREAEAVRAALNARPLPIKPCHCDPLAENFLDTGERVLCDRLGVCRQQRSDVGPGRRLGRGRLRPGPGRGAAGSLFRRQGARRATAAAWCSTRRCATCCGRCGASSST